MRIYLLELHLMRCDWSAGAIENQETRACRSLVDGANEELLELIFILAWDLIIVLVRSRSLL